jgi:hypothetical protein
MAVIPCAPSPPVLGIVQFSASEFVTAYPEFAGINAATPAALTNNFAVAELLLNNSCGSRVQDANQRQTLLYLLVAHLTLLSNGSNDGLGNVQPPVGIVGRIASATEGAVSVASEFEAPPNASQAYFIQTKYGALYWTLTARYRTFVYLAPPGGCGPLGGSPGLGWGGGCGC